MRAPRANAFRDHWAGELRGADAGTEVELKNIEEVRVKDDTAEADVRVSLDGTEESLTWSATRVGDDWLLCSP